MKITDITWLRLVGPLVHGQGGPGETRIGKTIVRVDTDADIHGLGEVDDFAGVYDALRYMKHYFQGRDPFSINAITSEMMYGTLPPHPANAKHGLMHETLIACPSSSPTATPNGPVAWAAAGVEMALCDLCGKALGTPAYNLLGGAFRDKVRVYLDRSCPDDVRDPAAWKRLAHDSLSGGFKFLKFDIDYTASDRTPDVWNRSLSTEQINRIVERIGSVREVLGPDIELSVDCHRNYNVPDAIRLAQALEPFRLMWLEDPTPHTNPDSCARVREKSPIPICIGEMFIAEEFRIFIDRGACDILHPDILFCGGAHELRRIADYGELHHLPLAIHGNGGAVATIAAAHAAAASRAFLGLEYHFIDTDWIGGFVKRDLPLFRDGFIELNDAPGFGIELDREICRKYRVAGDMPID
jgi:L-alanine-DL-glutamate epimerase-like enolase superfamily enzyme